MASTFKFHSQTQETVPWSAQYAFPTQSVKVKKQTVKLVPKNGSTFSAGNKIIRIEFPADNYLNVLNSVLQFDLKLSGTKTDIVGIGLQQGGAQNLIKRLRIMYGSLVIEDIQDYKTLVRIFTEAGVSEDYMSSTGTLLDGMHTSKTSGSEGTPQKKLTTLDTGDAAGTTAALIGDSTYAGVTRLQEAGALNLPDLVVAREQLNFIGTVSGGLGTQGYTVNTDTAYDLNTNSRMFCLNLLSGLLTQKKLIPLKWMASQLSIELTLADFADAFVAVMATGATYPTDLAYEIKNVNFIAEMVEFDSTYDAAFMMGLAKTGVPIHFSSFHWHTFNFNGVNQTFQIHERARSVKAVYAVIRDSTTPALNKDSDNFFADLTLVAETTADNAAGALVYKSDGGRIKQFQFRVGGQYYPAQPVRCDGGGGEAYVELLKAVNYLGDYTVPTNIDYTNWTNFIRPKGPTKFIMATELENTDVMPDSISGINAEEQNDIALNIQAIGSTVTTKQLSVYCHYDALLIIRDQNTVDLVF